MVKNGKSEFEKFYNTHLDKVYRFVFFRSGANKELTEDLVSEIFMKALEHFDSYDETLSQSAWVMTIARNHLINYWRDNKKTYSLPESQELEDGDSTVDAFWLKSAKHFFDKEQNRREVYEALAKLSPEDAEIVTFHYLLGYSYSEIAAIKHTSEGAIKVAAHRAIKKLRIVV